MALASTKHVSVAVVAPLATHALANDHRAGAGAGAGGLELGAGAGGRSWSWGRLKIKDAKLHYFFT